MSIKNYLQTVFAFLFFYLSIASGQTFSQTVAEGLILPEEKHLANMQQLTFGGENAECYFSFDGKQFIFQ